MQLVSRPDAVKEQKGVCSWYFHVHKSIILNQICWLWYAAAIPQLNMCSINKHSNRILYSRLVSTHMQILSDIMHHMASGIIGNQYDSEEGEELCLNLICTTNYILQLFPRRDLLIPKSHSRASNQNLYGSESTVLKVDYVNCI